jgi:hypothetical protein
MFLIFVYDVVINYLQYYHDLLILIVSYYNFIVYFGNVFIVILMLRLFLLLIL